MWEFDPINMPRWSPIYTLYIYTGTVWVLRETLRKKANSETGKKKKIPSKNCKISSNNLFHIQPIVCGCMASNRNVTSLGELWPFGEKIKMCYGVWCRTHTHTPHSQTHWTTEIDDRNKNQFFTLHIKWVPHNGKRTARGMATGAVSNWRVDVVDHENLRHHHHQE